MNLHDIKRAQRNILNAIAVRNSKPGAPTGWIVRGKDITLHTDLTFREAKAIAAGIRARGGYASAERHKFC